jgi:hypothetical protein
VAKGEGWDLICDVFDRFFAVLTGELIAPSRISSEDAINGMESLAEKEMAGRRIDERMTKC